MITIATNKYIKFVERLYKDIEDNFLKGHFIQRLLFTDQEVLKQDNLKVSIIKHEPWQCPHLKNITIL